MDVGRATQAKAQKYETARCVLGAVQVSQHGWEQKIQGWEFSGILGIRRKCCVILTSHILCWGNEKQMVNMLPNMAQDLGKAGDNLIPVWGAHRTPWPWSTSFYDLHPKPRAGCLAHILPLMHKNSNGKEAECPLYQSGLPHWVWVNPAVLGSHGPEVPQEPSEGHRRQFMVLLESSTECCQSVGYRTDYLSWKPNGKPPYFKEIYSPGELRWGRFTKKPPGHDWTEKQKT